MDTSISHRLNQTVVKIEKISDSIAIISGNFNEIAKTINNKNGTVARLLTDTTFVHNLNKSMENIKDGSQGFNDNMEALKHTFLFRKYFKKQNKKKKN